MSDGKLNIDEITQVTLRVVKGAGLGAVIHGQDGQNKLAKAVAGLDDALCSAVEASKLAIEEAMPMSKHSVNKIYSTLLMILMTLKPCI
ncbi:hypothetical protein PEC18_19105 [Paucibacter sp. O1-1]|nr:hypothetical protein [Paucibacter sp. O1-1]MDA3827901.1 hypothetical protein [Paucibacter sp. O1-1]